MAAVQLNPLHNFWSDVFDFTPAEGASSKHWQLLAAGTSLQQHMGQVPQQVQQLLPDRPIHYAQQHKPQQQQQQQQQQEDAKQQAAEHQGLTEQDQLAAFCTAGALCCLQDIPEGCFAFLLFAPGQHGAVLQWLAAQFSCPASSSMAVEHSSNSSSSSGDVIGEVAGIAAVEDITVDECSGLQESSQADVATAAEPATEAATHARCKQQGEQQQQVRPLLLHTNEAAVPAEVLQQIAAAACWSQAQLKQLNAGKAAAVKTDKQDKQGACYIGLEVSCGSVEQQAALCSDAAALGALGCSSLQAAKLFRNLGTDG
jgi:hypothetical protein